MTNYIDLLLQEFNKVVPGVKLKIKQHSMLMKTINIIVKPFCPWFMTDYVTTIGKTIYWPEKFPTEIRDLVILAHEFVHIYDDEKHPFLYKVSYLFPQILALLAIFAFVSKWALLFLIFLLPFPAYFRTKIELRGYTMSMATRYWRALETNYTHYIKKFTASDYYFMCPFKTHINNELNGRMADITGGHIIDDSRPDNEPYRIVYKFFKDNDLLHARMRATSEIKH